VLQHSVVANYEHFAGGSESTKPRPSGALPALWLIGEADRNIPPVQSAALLRSIKRQQGKDWTIITFPGAGHGLFDPRAAPIAEAWIRRHVRG
jgi:dienelactone hydrolase